MSEVIDTADGMGSVAALAGLVAAVRDLAVAGEDSLRLDQIRLLEELRSVTAAAQARVTEQFAASQRAKNLAAGVPAERANRGVANQVGLARRISPWQAQRYLGWVKTVLAELPDTFAELQAGRTSEWRATLVARETVFLSREHRAQVDAHLAPRLEALGDKLVAAEARRVAQRLDPAGAVERARNAEQDRRVSLRPAPDTMARLSALLPVAQGVACLAALNQAADSLIATGEPRSRDQVKADLLVERITGQASADAVPVEVHLLVPTDVLLNPDGPDGAEPVQLAGYGPVPAGYARDLIQHATDAGKRAWLRRLFTRPGTGELVAMESRRRLFSKAQRDFVTARDQVCRTPWCEAPIRHIDHIVPADSGGPTSIDNGQGLCEACNHAKQAPGWRARPGPQGEVVTSTPTGHDYRSSPPRPPGSGAPSWPAGVVTDKNPHGERRRPNAGPPARGPERAGHSAGRPRCARRPSRLG